MTRKLSRHGGNTLFVGISVGLYFVVVPSVYVPYLSILHSIKTGIIQEEIELSKLISSIFRLI